MDNHTNHGDSAVQSSALPHAAVTPSPRKKKKLLHMMYATARMPLAGLEPARLLTA